MADTQQLQEFNRLLGQRIKELIPVQTIWAVCKSVNWDNKTMIATGTVDDLDYHEVALGKGWEYKKPKQGAICLIGIVEHNPATAFLIDADEIEEISITSDNTSLIITPEGFKIEREGENMFTCIKDLITCLLYTS